MSSGGSEVRGPHDLNSLGEDSHRRAARPGPEGARTPPRGQAQLLHQGVAAGLMGGGGGLTAHAGHVSAEGTGGHLSSHHP